MTFTLVFYIISILSGTPEIIYKSEINSGVIYDNKKSCQKYANELTKQVNDVVANTVDNGRYSIIICKESKEK